MLRLSVDRGSRWIELPHGVRVLVRPLDTAISEAAFAESVDRVAPLKKAAEDAEAAGMPLPADGANGANAAFVSGLQWQVLIEAHARYGIEAWEGVGDEGGQPLPLSPDAIVAFAAHPVVGRAFFHAYREPLEQAAAEGNGSGSFASGDTAAALPSIAEAAPSAPPGAAATASDPAAPAAQAA